MADMQNQVTAPVVVKSSCCGGNLHEAHSHDPKTPTTLKRSESVAEFMEDLMTQLQRIQLRLDEISNHLQLRMSNSIPDDF